MPRIDLDRTLLWLAGQEWKYGEVPKVQEKRTCKNILLPTWSWGSRKGVIGTVGRRTNIFLGAVTGWMVIHSSGNPQRLETKGIEPSRMDWYDIKMYADDTDPIDCYTPKSPQVYMALAWTNGCIENSWSSDTNEQISLPDLERDSNARWPNYAQFWEEAFKQPCANGRIFGGTTSIPEGHHDNLHFSESRVFLGARTQTAFFGIRPHKHDEQNDRDGLPLWCGRYQRSHEISDEHGHTWVCSTGMTLL